MQKIKYTILFLFIALSFSCKKEMKKTVVDGIVRDFITGNPLGGVEVYLMEGESSAIQTLINNHIFKSMVTSSDGKFHFEFKALREKLYGMEYQKPSECYYDKSSYKVNTGEKNSIDLKLHSVTTLYIHVKNVSPFDTNDHICFVMNPDVTGCLTSGLYGMSVDYFTDLPVDAYEKKYIKSFITKNSVTTVRLDSITLQPCSPQTFDLFY